MSNKILPTLECTECHNSFSVENEYYICPNCKGTLDVKYDLETLSKFFTRSTLSQRPKGMWKYHEVLPVLQKKNIRSLGEGGTPLIKSRRLKKEINLPDLYLKNEGLNPTGSFKARQVSVGISKAVEFNKKVVGVVSSGNVGVASAAYAAYAGMKCHIIIWAEMEGLGNPRIKMAPAMLFGANVNQTRPSKSPFFIRDSLILMRDFCIEKNWVPLISARCVNPFAEEGAKTIAYEICDDLNWNVPDWVCLPIGGGGLLSEVWKGFLEMKTLGLIEKLPRLAGFQSGSFQHVALAFRRELDAVEPLYTMLENNTSAYSLDGEWALRSIRQSKGFADIISNEKVLETQKKLAINEGIIAEPMAAWGLAGLISAIDNGKIQHDEKVVVCITGKNVEYSPLLLEDFKIRTIKLEEIEKLAENY